MLGLSPVRAIRVQPRGIRRRIAPFLIILPSPIMESAGCQATPDRVGEVSATPGKEVTAWSPMAFGGRMHSIGRRARRIRAAGTDSRACELQRRAARTFQSERIQIIAFYS